MKKAIISKSTLYIIIDDFHWVRTQLSQDHFHVFLLKYVVLKVID
jgi:hypothetical protein